jgi:hypothetical protein
LVSADPTGGDYGQGSGKQDGVLLHAPGLNDSNIARGASQVQPHAVKRIPEARIRSEEVEPSVLDVS